MSVLAQQIHNNLWYIVFFGVLIVLSFVIFPNGFTLDVKEKYDNKKPTLFNTPQEQKNYKIFNLFHIIMFILIASPFFAYILITIYGLFTNNN